MANLEFWIQLENHAWDIAPNNIDRMTGQDMNQITGLSPEVVTLSSPETGVKKTRKMYSPMRMDGKIQDALILRRYTENWAKPDDRKVNPWDQNERDPTDNGTMGTIPGAVIECSVGDNVVVHFRNKDNRMKEAFIVGPFGESIKMWMPLPIPSRSHSLHPHGFVFSPSSDGAYPLSPPDLTQPVGSESALWAGVGVTGSKKGDRVPPGGTFDYHWNTNSWPTTAGVWLYHDHSVCDTHNVQLGAIGIIVIHNSQNNDPDEVVTQDLPGGTFIGSPITSNCLSPTIPISILPHDLNLLGLEAHPEDVMSMDGKVIDNNNHSMPDKARIEKDMHPGHGEPTKTISVKRGEITLNIDPKAGKVLEICHSFYRTPPEKAQYLLLFHNLLQGGMCINGRKFLGNTPTLIGGENTKMRFGVVGMGNSDGFHTFHLHGHRWVMPGPDGNIKTNPTSIQSSAQVIAVSQFEDTRTFGPANSFVFTINEGSFMGSQPGSKVGEYHMHCHVLTHMMDGMMGSLLLVKGGELALGLPSGELCPEDMQMGGMGMGGGNGTTTPAMKEIVIGDNFYSPSNLAITSGTKVRWTYKTGSSDHTVTSNLPPSTCTPASIGPDSLASPFLFPGQSFEHQFNMPGVYHYHCDEHGCSMQGTVTVT